MSTIQVSDIISQALIELGDPNAQRYSRAQMLSIYNRVNLKIATTLKCLEADVFFDVVAGECRYGYPADLLQVRKVRWSKTTTPTVPTDLGDYYRLKEVFDDEYTAATDFHRPQAYVWGYSAELKWIEVLNTPTDDIPKGGILTMRHRPTKITTEDLPTELPDFLEGHIQEGMQILARMTGRERVAAAQDKAAWDAETEKLIVPIQDRSDDRRPSIRPVRPTMGWMR